MAILNGIISKLNGSAGNLTFKQLCGKILVSTKYLNCDNALLAEYQSKSASGLDLSTLLFLNYLDGRGCKEGIGAVAVATPVVGG